VCWVWTIGEGSKIGGLKHIREVRLTAGLLLLKKKVNTTAILKKKVNTAVPAEVEVKTQTQIHNHSCSS
jgi:ribosomal protein L39E